MFCDCRRKGVDWRCACRYRNRQWHRAQRYRRWVQSLFPCENHRTWAVFLTGRNCTKRRFHHSSSLAQWVWYQQFPGYSFGLSFYTLCWQLIATAEQSINLCRIHQWIFRWSDRLSDCNHSGISSPPIHRRVNCCWNAIRTSPHQSPDTGQLNSRKQSIVVSTIEK